MIKIELPPFLQNNLNAAKRFLQGNDAPAVKVAEPTFTGNDIYVVRFPEDTFGLMDPKIASQWGEYLSRFLSNHPDLELVSVDQVRRPFTGFVMSVNLICRLKQKQAQ